MYGTGYRPVLFCFTGSRIVTRLSLWWQNVSIQLKSAFRYNSCSMVAEQGLGTLKLIGKMAIMA